VDTTFELRCKSVVNSLGLCCADDVSSIKRLAGGIASDIAAVTFGKQTICVKFALEKLRVKEVWFAPVHRSKTEFAWLSVAAQVVPDATPTLYGWSDAENGFAMEYIGGGDVCLWKSSLLAGADNKGESCAVATTIGRIHGASTKSGFDRTAFDTAADFESLRIDPYLRFTASRHPDIAPQLIAMANQLATSRLALIHGDVSPKNILIRAGQPILLDAECASMGDPAFDVAFCLNHLLLKSIHLPDTRTNLIETALQFWDAYVPHITWEDNNQMEARVTVLLPALMLARIDGKSPVEYLSEASRTRVRAITRPLIDKPLKNIRAFLEAMQQEVNA
jgi:tRNA A-37 threonylcarbamoyl transferase component Bud32